MVVGLFALCVDIQRYWRVMEEDHGPVIPGREAEAATGANEDGEFFDPVLLEVRHSVGMCCYSTIGSRCVHVVLYRLWC